MGMDGTGGQTIVTDDLFYPKALTIDYTTMRLWWLESEETLIE